MTRKIKPIVRGNLIVFPCPQAREAMKRDAQESRPTYNDIQKVIAKTMHSQRYSKTSRYALEKLRKMNLNPA